MFILWWNLGNKANRSNLRWVKVINEEQEKLSETIMGG